MTNNNSRRTFLKTSALGLTGLTVVPAAVMGKATGKSERVSPSDKLNIAAVGIGGMGRSNIEEMATENMVAFCDVDWKYAANSFNSYPKAKRYKDFRKMYEEMGKSIDAVLVATADHTHAIIAAEAITMGKHVYVQKPLTHSVYESRLLTKLAEKYKVATQMGNQGASRIGTNRTLEWLWNGEIGEVTRVDASTDRPIWPQGLNRPEREDLIPETLDWDLFIGPALTRPYNNIYHPWNWRGWWDFGTGALGDMACHILHVAFEGLQLKYPTKVQGTSTVVMSDCCPTAEKVIYTFPARGVKDKLKLPEVEITWYDGGFTPPRPAGADGKDIKNSTIFYGTKDTLICGSHGGDPWLTSGRVPKAPKKRREINVSHEQDWIRACKESPENRVKTASDFSLAGPFNEMVVMGVLAVRLQNLKKELLWDGENMRFTNIGADEKLSFRLQNQFSVVNGDPRWNNKDTKAVCAQPFAEELIKHNYREGWKLPDMPF
ncbi:MAG: Gfo/Idh/MocA family protein [Mangrovibacterium sp.]